MPLWSSAPCEVQRANFVSCDALMLCAGRRGLQGVHAVLEAAQHAAPSGQVVDGEGAGRGRRLMEISVFIKRHQASGTGPAGSTPMQWAAAAACE